jgi:DNA polymerase III epsilon subunit
MELSKLLEKQVFCVLDTETTGLSPRNGDRIVEIAIYKIDLSNDYKLFDKYVKLINPERYIPLSVSKIHGIYDYHVEKAPKFYEICESFLEFIGSDILVIQNAPFDLSFLNNELRLCSHLSLENEIIDTISMSWKVFKGHTKHNLDTICQRLNINTEVQRHRAEGDVIITAEAFIKMRDILITKMKHSD